MSVPIEWRKTWYFVLWCEKIIGWVVQKFGWVVQKNWVSRAKIWVSWPFFIWVSWFLGELSWYRLYQIKSHNGLLNFTGRRLSWGYRVRCKRRHEIEGAVHWKGQKGGGHRWTQEGAKVISYVLSIFLTLHSLEATSVRFKDIAYMRTL